MTSAVVNSNQQNHYQKHGLSLSHSQISEGDNRRSDDFNEDFTSYKIIEMLKQDKFMQRIDSLNNVQNPQNIQKAGDSAHPQSNLFNARIPEGSESSPQLLNPLNEEIGLFGENYESCGKGSSLSEFDNLKEGNIGDY